MTTTNQVDALLRARAAARLNTQLDQVFGALSDLLGSDYPSADPDLKDAFDAMRASSYAYLIPIYETKEITDFLGTAQVQTLVNAS